MSDSVTTAPASGATSAPAREPGQPSPWLRAVAKAESIPGLDGLGDTVGKLIAPMTERRPLMDLLNGRWLGHALEFREAGEPAGT